MTNSTTVTFGYDDGDIDTNRTAGDSLNDMISHRYSRRDALRGGVSAAAFAVLGGSVLAACDGGNFSDAFPVVMAGSSGTTSSGRIVTLTGTATDNGTIISQSFTQVSGPPVSLVNATSTAATFIAPSVSASTPLVFRYTAVDSVGQATTAETMVTVNPATLGFTAVAKNRLDTVSVPAGYSVSILYRLGDPISSSTAAYKNDGSDTDFANRAGDHGDALYWFGLAASGSTRDDSSSTRGLLVMNHENINQPYLHVAGATTVAGARPEAEALKEMECHGLSVVEVSNSGGAWSYAQGGALNRRITPLTPTMFSGPVRGSALLQTVFSPTGVAGRGTVNNCANGYTPWGTDLTCEENWAGYFRRPTAADNPRRTAKEVTALARYAVTSATGNFGWATVVPADPASTIYRRWDVQATGASALADFRNEHNQFGWVVEIDPYDKTAAPRKRTALGRMNHEGCWPSNFVAGRKPAFYMGDDAVNEYLYKFVSATAWSAADASSANRLAIGDKYLDSGTLHVAKFNADGTGQWLPLTFGTGPLTVGSAPYPFADQVDVLTHARLAGDALGATKMDRPEWTAVNPVSGEVYLTLTNNSTRTPANTDAANPRAYLDPPSSSVSNRNGHIIRLRETGDSSEATSFAWDIYLFGAGSDLEANNINLSGLDATNDFSSPDGLNFGRSSHAGGLVTPLLWIQTDDSAYTDVTNCMMLAAMPGPVNDGAVKTITNTPTGGAGVAQATRVGKAPGTLLRRFLVGPLEAEITGVDSTPDGKTLFVNIQHPGELGNTTNITSNWPASQTAPAPGVRPRSATVVITKNDGGVVAL
ncbi:MAG: phosphatase [Sphingomonas bacterium]|uniref:PhoX family protein n=1 Tax=Sphingomonas bacterium TaxID=1895847 RepID=UPI0026384A12|nr:alkaline phosphatase PhoX [Sphingomonas bacterium]MDB5707580.1 phosphatase [Sphingomonas bacterium]